MKNFFFLTLLILFLISSCKEEDRAQYSMDDVPPGEITGLEVENLPGKVKISYDIPSDEDLLYVKAIYKLDNGMQMEQKASAYTNTIELIGFGKSHEQTVTLIAGDRSKNESKPIEVKIHPQDAPIYEILEKMTIRNDFGGIRLDWENPLQADVVLTVSSPDDTNTLAEVESFYSNSRKGSGNLRGYPAEEKIFAVYLRDRWGNRTDTVISTYLPLFEEKLDRLKFQKWNPSGIPDLGECCWVIRFLWDGSLGNPGFAFPSTAVLPESFTFDTGQTAKLSRFKLFQRSDGGQLYSGGNIKRFKVYGSDHPNVNKDISTWAFLGEFESHKPSGLPLGQTSAEDRAYAGVAGEDYNIEFNAPPVRYLRFLIEKTWSGSNSMQVMEIELFGDIQK